MRFTVAPSTATGGPFGFLVFDTEAEAGEPFAGCTTEPNASQVAMLLSAAHAQPDALDKAFDV